MSGGAVRDLLQDGDLLRHLILQGLDPVDRRLADLLDRLQVLGHAAAQTVAGFGRLLRRRQHGLGLFVEGGHRLGALQAEPRDAVVDAFDLLGQGLAGVAAGTADLAQRVGQRRRMRFDGLAGVAHDRGEVALAGQDLFALTLEGLLQLLGLGRGPGADPHQLLGLAAKHLADTLDVANDPFRGFLQDRRLLLHGLRLADALDLGVVGHHGRGVAQHGRLLLHRADRLSGPLLGMGGVVGQHVEAPLQPALGVADHPQPDTGDGREDAAQVESDCHGILPKGFETGGVEEERYRDRQPGDREEQADGELYTELLEKSGHYGDPESGRRTRSPERIVGLPRCGPGGFCQDGKFT